MVVGQSVTAGHHGVSFFSADLGDGSFKPAPGSLGPLVIVQDVDNVADLEELALSLLFNDPVGVLGRLLLNGGVRLFLSLRLLLVVGLVSERSFLPDLDDVVHVDSILEQGVVVVQLLPLEDEPLQVLGQIKPKN